MAESVVRVYRTNQVVGTGFVCYSQPTCTLVMTAGAVVADLAILYAVGFPNQTEPINVHVLRVNHTSNLALLASVPNPQQHPCHAVEFADLNAQMNSGAVVVPGFYAMGIGETLLAPGIFRGHICGDAMFRGEVHCLRCDYTAEAGLEGAPVLQDGRVTGVHSRSEGRIQIATSVTSIFTTLLQWLGLPPAMGDNVGISELLQMIANA